MVGEGVARAVAAEVLGEGRVLEVEATGTGSLDRRSSRHSW